MSIAANCAPFVDSVLLMSIFAVSINDVSVDVGPVQSRIFPPIVNQTQFGSSFSGCISATSRLYDTLFPFGT